MTATNTDRPSIATLRQEAPAADCGPMIQQDHRDAHGHDMHPQELVRLVGCHDVSAQKPEKAASAGRAKARRSSPRGRSGG